MKEVTENEERFKGERIGQLYIVNIFLLNKLENYFQLASKARTTRLLTFTNWQPVKSTLNLPLQLLRVPVQNKRERSLCQRRRPQ